ncbi:putative amidohydrolase [Altererythrobacter atlanticus]|uniref:2-oxoglutaramate amidase n=1 Tax=Croceibacterium atlanticum TaxID=1267766 RepID=A0A0F7KM61_9SPHN|nr:carbon-nitrogen hydrolase family protein [Croceibacterium atlanticum]AKH41648.1 2-oxoglutaramate amidase [Croceibacterium atlanticum]MBB5733112.1 putative amidohydrolase [Croceibacterium atlanticum]
MTRIALLQMTSGIDPEDNEGAIIAGIAEAAEGGAAMIFTPEMCAMLDRNRKRATPHVVPEGENRVLAAARDASAKHGIWTALGSLAVRREDGRWANRSLIIDERGEIAARYDKIHMFDVQLSDGESWRESATYAPGEEVVIVDTPIGRLGLAVCYDIRFPALFDALGRRKCDAIAIPAAFTVPTGKAHWHLLQRARAVEASAYVIAAAQVGEHADGRRTFGHSLVVDPWGDMALDMGEAGPGLGYAEIDPARIADIRAQLPSLANRREILTAQGQ